MRNENLISFRKEKKLSVASMAEAIGISESYYEKIEHMRRSPSYNFLVKFKMAFPEADTEHIFLSQNHTVRVEQ